MSPPETGDNISFQIQQDQCQALLVLLKNSVLHPDGNIYARRGWYGKDISGQVNSVNISDDFVFNDVF